MPESLEPPNAVRRSRRNQLLIQQMPTSICAATRCARAEVGRSRPSWRGRTACRSPCAPPRPRCRTAGRGSRGRRSPPGPPWRSRAGRSRSSARIHAPFSSSLPMSGTLPPVTTLAPSSTAFLKYDSTLLRCSWLMSGPELRAFGLGPADLHALAPWPSAPARTCRRSGARRTRARCRGRSARCWRSSRARCRRPPRRSRQSANTMPAFLPPSSIETGARLLRGRLHDRGAGARLAGEGDGVDARMAGQEFAGRVGAEAVHDVVDALAARRPCSSLRPAASRSTASLPKA